MYDIEVPLDTELELNYLSAGAGKFFEHFKLSRFFMVEAQGPSLF